MNREIVNRAVDGLSLAQKIQMPDHQVGLQSGGLVVIQAAALLVSHFIVALVVAVVAEDGDVVRKTAHDVVHQGRLATAAAAGNADDENVVHIFLPPFLKNASLRGGRSPPWQSRNFSGQFS